MKLQKETSLRKIIIIGISIIAIFLVIFFIFIKAQYRAYSKDINDKINIIISQVIEQYPEIKEVLNNLGTYLTDEVMQDLNYQVDELGKSPEKVPTDFLSVTNLTS